MQISSSSLSASNPLIVVNSSDKATAIWSSYDGANYYVQTAYLQSLHTWSSPLTISGASEFNIVPSMGIDGSGNIVAVWIRQNGTTYTLEAAVSLANSHSWTIYPINIPGYSGNTFPYNNQAGLPIADPKLSVNANGQVAMIFTYFDGFKIRLATANYTFGDSSWAVSGPFLTTNWSPINGQISINASGNAIAIWYIPVTGEIQFETAVGTTWGLNGMDIVTIGSEFDCIPSIGLADSGKAVATWYSYNGSTYSIEGAKYSGGSWSSPVNISSTGSFSPSVNVNVTGGGDAVAFWSQGSGLTYQIMTATLPASGTSNWSTPTALINNGGANTAEAFDSQGNIFATWSASSDGGNTWSIQIDQAPVLGSWSSPTTLSLSKESAVENSSDVAVYHTNYPFVVWVSQTTNGNYVAQAIQKKLSSQNTPLNIQGYQKLHRFPTQGDLVNVITWTPAADYEDFLYFIYEGNLSNLIGTTTNNQFEDHQILYGEVITYFVVANSRIGEPSDEGQITIP